jgi:hypothetical protein
MPSRCRFPAKCHNETEFILAVDTLEPSSTGISTMKSAIEIMQSMTAVAPWQVLIQIACCLRDCSAGWFGDGSLHSYKTTTLVYRLTSRKQALHLLLCLRYSRNCIQQCRPYEMSMFSYLAAIDESHQIQETFRELDKMCSKLHGRLC